MQNCNENASMWVGHILGRHIYTGRLTSMHTQTLFNEHTHAAIDIMIYTSNAKCFRDKMVYCEETNITIILLIF